ncbi:MAG: hypothetical protein RLP44_21340 [Aggregatilineales bacterium]
MATIIVQGEITQDGKLKVTLPEGLVPGTVEVEIRQPENRTSNLAALLNSDIVGMWADRDDIGDTGDFARQLRHRASRRSNGISD